MTGLVFLENNIAPQCVIVGVCTCGRPQMLAECLDSLGEQLTLPDITIEIVVVDNQALPVARGIVDAFRRRSPFPVHFIHEPRRGIATARNRVLDHATERCAQWVAFIDDDEIAEPDWVSNLMAPGYRGPILAGAVRRRWPSELPFWCLPRERKDREEGKRIKHAVTGNVRFSTDLIRAGLRFNEELRLMGGEDQEFFTAAHNAGFEIRQTERAVVVETVHLERQTYSAHVYRAYWCAASDVRRLAIAKGWWNAISCKAHTIPFLLVAGPIEVLASPLFLVGGVRMFKRRAISGGKKTAKAIGRAAAMIGHLPQPYRVIAGR